MYGIAVLSNDCIDYVQYIGYLEMHGEEYSERYSDAQGWGVCMLQTLRRER